MAKRLFIFASYDKDSIVDDTVLHYLNELSVFGDIIFVMDNDTPNEELAKVQKIPNVIHAGATRHGEYDFGSYKRGYKYAKDNKLLEKYDWIYFVNDSVYGPLWNLRPILEDLESRGTDYTGIIDYQTANESVFIQSWFFGLSRKLATQKFISDWWAKICRQEDKMKVVFVYEHGLSYLIKSKNFKMATFIAGQNGDVRHDMYDAPFVAMKNGVPFLKKSIINDSFEWNYLYAYTDTKLISDIKNCEIRTKKISSNQNVYSVYEKCFRLTLFSLPIVTVFRQGSEAVSYVSYKVCLFDFIPLIKIALNKKKGA